MVEQSGESDKRLGFRVVVIGLGIMALTLAVAVVRWTVAADVTSVISGMGSIVGSLVGAFFGIQLGSAGRKDAEKNAADANRRLAFATAHLAPEHRTTVMNLLAQPLPD